jgi:uncharacterized RDD family membrane protein YckC
MALLYDTFLVLPLIMFSVALATGAQLIISGGGSAERVDSVTLHPQIVQVIALITIVVFYCWFWRIRGQTLGMQAWRIRLRGSDGNPVTLKQALLRCAGALVSLAVFGAGFWWCLFDREGRYWHDRWSGTSLELLPKTKNSE